MVGQERDAGVLGAGLSHGKKGSASRDAVVGKMTPKFTNPAHRHGPRSGFLEAEPEGLGGGVRHRRGQGQGPSQGVVPAEVWPWPDSRGTLEHHLHYRVAPIPADSWLPPVEGSVASQGCPSLDEVA